MITRPATQRSASLVPDLAVLVVLAALLYAVVRVARRWEAPLQPQVDINLIVWALPTYTVLSLLRGLAAYGLSLTFALTYGYLTAHHPLAERLLIPLLDILQSIPVLGFLPGLVLALVAVFPNTNAGLELASILMIFTGQVWNMAFGFYQSLRSIPHQLREASQVYQFNWWQRFRRVELPASATSLAWNSMMSMAGGWFFLMVCEAFTLGSHDFRLPGLGAYMSVAIARHNVPAILEGIGAMVLMIVAVDACVWRPVLVWVQKFRIEETASSDIPGSVVLNWFRRSWLAQEAMTRLAHPISEWLSANANREHELQARLVPRQYGVTVTRAIRVVFLAVASAVVLWGAWRLVHLVSRLQLHDWTSVLCGAVWTFLRVLGAVVLGSVWTVPVGIWIGRSSRWRSRLQPFVQVAASFPAPMLYPLVLLLLHGVGVQLNVIASFLMLLGTQWYILFNVIAGASAVPHELREASDAYRFTPWQRWRIMWWPSVFPYVITGWVTAAGGAWNASIVAEYVTVGQQEFVAPGLGSLISLSASQGHYELLAAAVLMMAVVVVLINRFLWKPLYRMAEVRYAL